MDIRVWSTALGSCTLTDAHAASSHGQMVLVDASGAAHGTAEVSGYLHHGVTRYDAAIRVEYTDAQIEALRAVVLHAYSTRPDAHYGIGASLHALVDAQTIRAQAETVTGQPIPVC